MRQIPNITRNLLIINVLAFALMWVLQTVTANSATPVDLNDWFGLHFFLASDFHLYQLVSYMFMHGGWMHLFFNMFALWMFGCVIENVLGSKRFLFYYILCGIGAGLVQEAAQFVNYAVEGLAAYDTVSIHGVRVPMDAYLNRWTTVGASGSIYAILLAFGMIFPENKIFIFPLPVPIKAKWFVVIYAAIELYYALSTTNDGVAHIAHLGGMVFGFFLLRYWKKHPAVYYRSSHSGGVFGKMKRKWDNRNEGRSTGGYSSTTSSSADMNWDRASQNTNRQQEIDIILDKIRKSGYDSLTKEEKQKLFDQSRNR